MCLAVEGRVIECHQESAATKKVCQKGGMLWDSCGKQDGLDLQWVGLLVAYNYRAKKHCRWGNQGTDVDPTRPLTLTLDPTQTQNRAESPLRRVRFFFLFSEL